jgi:hypothetical protein
LHLKFPYLAQKNLFDEFILYILFALSNNYRNFLVQFSIYSCFSITPEKPIFSIPIYFFGNKNISDLLRCLGLTENLKSKMKNVFQKSRDGSGLAATKILVIIYNGISIFFLYKNRLTLTRNTLNKKYLRKSFTLFLFRNSKTCDGACILKF